MCSIILGVVKLRDRGNNWFPGGGVRGGVNRSAFKASSVNGLISV
jgi:hypothetical protein